MENTYNAFRGEQAENHKIKGMETNPETIRFMKENTAIIEEIRDILNRIEFQGCQEEQENDLDSYSYSIEKSPFKFLINYAES